MADFHYQRKGEAITASHAAQLPLSLKKSSLNTGSHSMEVTSPSASGLVVGGAMEVVEEVKDDMDKVLGNNEVQITELLKAAHNQDNKVLDLTNIDFSSDDVVGQNFALQLIADILMTNELLEFVHIDVTKTRISARGKIKDHRS